MIPSTGLKQYILDLAERHGVTYVKIAHDELADMITRLSNDNVDMDEVELLLLALAASTSAWSS